MTKHQGKPSTIARRPQDEADQVLEGELVTRTPGQSGMMQVRTKHITAMKVQVPRNLAEGKDSVLAKCIKEAELAAEDFLYSWTVETTDKRTGEVKPSLIEGISIDGAMIMLRNFMNCTCEIEIIEDAPEHWVLQATFLDFETGLSVPRLFRQRKSGVFGRMDADRKLDIAFQIGQSKAQRNAIDKAMPTWLKAQCIEASKKAAAAKVKDLPDAIAKLVTAFAEWKVTEEQLARKIGAPRAQWTAMDVVRMRAVYAAIKAHQTQVETEFPAESPKEEPSAPEVEGEPVSGPKVADGGEGVASDKE